MLAVPILFWLAAQGLGALLGGLSAYAATVDPGYLADPARTGAPGVSPSDILSAAAAARNAAWGAFVGALLGLGVGAGLGAAIVRALKDNGFTEFALPWTLMAVYLVAGAVVGVVAAVIPAIRAARLNVLAAIAYE
jgi:hypothetical protein